MSYLTKLTKVRIDAIDYITSVLKNRGSDYQLIDPASYEDGNFQDDVYELPRGLNVDRHGYHEEHPIVSVDIDNEDILTFKGIGGLGDTGNDHDYTAGELESFTLCSIADMISNFENQ